MLSMCNRFAQLTERDSTLVDKVIIALFYGGSSIAIMFVNKIVLTSLEFPSFNFLALLQYAFSVLILSLQRWVFRSVHFPPLSWSVLWDVMPLPLLFLGNTVSGLGATKKMNMPMFVLLRRFSIVCTMLLEIRLLRKKFPSQVYLSIALMIFGAAVAAAGDFQTDLVAYCFVLANDVFTALQGVVLRKKMDEKEVLGTHGLMFYNNLFSLPIALLTIYLNGETASITNYDRWHSGTFLAALLLSGVMGFVLNFALYLCTKVNSPLTATVIGCLKNVLTSYLGMLLRDYSYTHLSFIGVNISVVGSLIYNHAEYKKIVERAAQQNKEKNNAV